ncbi:MAG: HNH endonuclease [Bacteroidales bacterium]|nr:HNH endonuclease [Bacteroidales bacterium]MDD3201370.1 HNH endonuclease [Bacteroidales bacterium]
MKYYIGNTDKEWYDYLSKIVPEDINFWQPGGNSSFKVLEMGAPFLLRLKSPINKIAGVGFFSSHSILPVNYAWEVFENKNGVSSYAELRRIINHYRGSLNLNENPNIGCIVLSSPIFFNENDWIDVPINWANSIVQGKSYETSEEIGGHYWHNLVEPLLYKYAHSNAMKEYTINDDLPRVFVDNEEAPRYGQYLTNVRIGQSAFRVLVTDAYKRRCSISGEKTLPVLEAAHIKSYSECGVNKTSNGILLRADIHKLYDNGYITITSNYCVEVSRRIKEEFENGRDYYKYHGQHVLILPDSKKDLPDKEYLRWHNENIYRG